MRADRLLSILMLLQTKGRMTAHDLAEQLEVSERTIYRDLEALSMAGVPVYAERGPGGGCALVDGYQTRLTGLTETEVQALFLLNIAGPLADLGLGRALDAAMLKLTAALPQSSREHADLVRQRFHLDTTWWYHSDDATSCLQVLQEALWHDRKLLLFYHEDDGAWSERLAEPYGLVSKAGVWYLVASCHDEKCVFRVTRIHHATISDEPFTRQADFELARYWSDYCIHIETNRPDYASSLRMAPDEAKSLPQLLHDCGYMLIEDNNEPSAKGNIQSGSRYQQQKKAIPYSSLASQVQKKAVSNSIETGPLQKKAISPGSKQTRIKKSSFSPLKKKLLPSSKKNKNGRHIKKSLYIPLPHSPLPARSIM